jgi:hypothetical protein
MAALLCCAPGACMGWQMTGTSTGAILALSSWTGGLATLVEKKSRRMELALYCLSRVRGLGVNMGFIALDSLSRVLGLGVNMAGFGTVCCPCSVSCAMDTPVTTVCLSVCLSIRLFARRDALSIWLIGSRPIWHLVPIWPSIHRILIPILWSVPQAAEALALSMVEWRWVRRDALPARTDVLLFSGASAAIMHCYSDGNGCQRDVFRSKYLNVLDFIFGNTGKINGRGGHWRACNLESAIDRLLSSVCLAMELRRGKMLCGALAALGCSYSWCILSGA